MTTNIHDITNFYLDYAANHKGIQKLPTVFPVVLYNGQRRWNAVHEIADLIEQEPSLGPYALHFQYLLLNEQSYTRQQLPGIRNIVSTLFLAEAHYDIALLEQELLNLYESEEDKQAISLFLNWFRQLALYSKVSLEDYGTLDHVYHTQEEVKTMLAAAFDEERKRYFREGRQEGREEGRQQGRKEGWQQGREKGREEGRAEIQRQMIAQLLPFRFDLPEAEQSHYAQQVATIRNADQLDQLFNVLLNKSSTLADFTALLAKYLPAGEGN